MQVNLCPPRTRFIPKVSNAASVNSGGQEASLERDYGRTFVERSRLKGRYVYNIYHLFENIAGVYADFDDKEDS